MPAENPIHGSDQQSCPSTLSAGGVAGLAIETGDRLPGVPVEMAEDAERMGLPPMELRKVVPFVAVTEACSSTTPCAA